MASKKIGILRGLGGGSWEAPDPFKTTAMKSLLTEYKNDLTVETIFIEDPEIAKRIAKMDAIITRPNWGVVIEKKWLEEALKGGHFKIATLSAGTNHIKDLSQEQKVKFLINDKSGGNADSTAEFTIWLAVTLRRRLQHKLFEMKHGFQFGRDYSDHGTLVGATWGLLGSGNVSMKVISRLIGAGVKKIKIWRRENKEDKEKGSEKVFKDKVFWKIIQPFLPEPLIYPNRAFEGRATGYTFKVHPFGGEEKDVCEIIYFLDSDESEEGLIQTINDSDIVSIHAGGSDRDYEKGGTGGILSKRLFGKIFKLKDNSIILNVGRDEHVKHPESFIEGLEGNKLGGYGTDVMSSRIECEGTPKDSVMWSYFIHSGFCITRNIWWARKITQMSPEGRNFPIKDYAGTFKNLVKNQDDKKISNLKFDFEGNFLTDKDSSNICATPHIAGAASDAEEKIAKNVVNELLRQLKLEIKCQ